MIRTGWLIFKTAIPIFASRNMQQHELLNAIDCVVLVLLTSHWNSVSCHVVVM